MASRKNRIRYIRNAKIRVKEGWPLEIIAARRE